MISTFKDNESAYDAWRSQNSNAYIFNHFGGNDPKMNVLHLASCVWLNREKDQGRRTAYEKVCSKDFEELRNKVEELRGRRWQRCSHCLGPQA